jgi:hypothetical protein
MLRRSFLSSTAATAAIGLAPLPVLAQTLDPLEAARRDPNAFVEYVSQWDRPLTQAPCHRRWQAAWNDPRSVVIGPTGFGKTTQALYRVLWEMGTNPEIEILWVGSRPDRYVKWLMAHVRDNPAVGEVFEGLAIQHDNGHSFSLERSSKSPGPTVAPCWVGSPEAFGTRADIVVVDDAFTYWALMSDYSATTAWLKELETRLRPGSRIMVIGFPYIKDDPLFHLAAKPGWTAVHEDAIEERADGADATQESLDPNIMTMAEIRRKELDLGRRFSAAMLRCRPIE